MTPSSRGNHVRMGVIGAGGMGSWHAGNLAGLDGVQVVAVSDADAAVAQRLAAQHGAVVVDANALIADPSIDALVIASPDATHAAYTIAAIEAGTPVLCEKPLAADLDDAAAVVAAEVRAGRRLVRLGFMRPLDPPHVALAAEVARLGPVTRLRCVHRNVDDTPRDVEKLFAQSMSHDIHTIRWLTGAELVQVQVHVATRSDGFRSILVVGELDNGALATIEFDDHAPHYEVHVEAICEGGIVSTRGGQPLGTDWFAWFADAYRAEIEEWVGDLRAGTFRGPTARDGYAAQAAAYACEVSLLSGRPVAVERRDADLMIEGEEAHGTT
jgi:myo-inositol 2-dehydrogenase / D-chiro-inositol 1-dehydrogenase